MIESALKYGSLLGAVALFAVAGATTFRGGQAEPETVVATAAAESVAAPVAEPAPGLVFADEAAFGAAIRGYLLENPEVIFEAVSVLEQRQAQQQAQSDADMVTANLDALHDTTDDWVGGNPEGDVTLVEFIDYRCSYCRRAHPETRDLVSADGNIRLIVKEFPILGEASLLSSRFAIAAKQLGGDEAYLGAHEALIALRGNPDEPTLRQLATELGLDPDQVFEVAQSDAVSAVIAKNHALAERLDIRGTPTYVLQDQMIRGYMPLETMMQALAEVRG